MSEHLAHTWDPEKYYGVNRWSDGYYGINSTGHVIINPHGPYSSERIDMSELIAEIIKRGIKFPLVFRFHDILHSQVKLLNESFIEAITATDYQGKYFGVYPVKVNQLREVVEEVSSYRVRKLNGRGVVGVVTRFLTQVELGMDRREM